MDGNVAPVMIILQGTPSRNWRYFVTKGEGGGLRETQFFFIYEGCWGGGDFLSLIYFDAVPNAGGQGMGGGAELAEEGDDALLEGVV